MSYTDSTSHRLTVAAIHTPAGQPVDVATHDQHCLWCGKAIRPDAGDHFCGLLGHNVEQDHTCQQDNGLTPAQHTEQCPRCQDLETRRQQQLQRLRDLCPHCGVDTTRQDCRRWCRADENPCTCGDPLCGDCMRRGGTSTSGLPVI